MKSKDCVIYYPKSYVYNFVYLAKYTYTQLAHKKLSFWIPLALASIEE